MNSARREVRLSRAGKVFVAFTLAIGFAAVNTGNNILFLLVSLMLAIMILSGMAAMVNLWHIELHMPAGQLLSAHQPAALQIELRNERSWGAWLLELQMGSARARWPYLRAGDTVRISLPWTAQERGQPPLPELLLGSSFPFAFVWRGRYRAIPRADWPWVAPAPGRWEALAQADNAEGARLDPGAGGQGDLLYLRPREEREPLQRVLWRRSVWQDPASGLGPYLPVVERERDGDEELWILDWDAPALAALDREERLQVLRAGLDLAVAQGRSWSLRLPGFAMNGRGSLGQLRALEALARQRPWPEYPPAERRQGVSRWSRSAAWWRGTRAS
ncbi:MAG: hypothetical protein ACP5GA_01065 [Acidithiobacillus sp.]